MHRRSYFTFPQIKTNETIIKYKQHISLNVGFKTFYFAMSEDFHCILENEVGKQLVICINT